MTYSLKDVFQFFVFIILLSGYASLASADFSGSGAGTEGDPYVITDCDQLQEMNESLTAWYRLNNHIECAASSAWNGGKGFDPVGDNSIAFSGNFNGAGYEIRNLYINRADDVSGFSLDDDENFVGLFGYTDGATIRNVKFINAFVKGYEYVGVVAGRIRETLVENIEVNKDSVGVVAVYPDGEPDSCSPLACVWARHGQNGGGIAGYFADSQVNNVIVGGAVKGSGEYIGGLAGSSYETDVTGATSTARIDGGYRIGGAFGLLSGGEIDNVVVSGDVVGEKVDSEFAGVQVGGFAGFVEDEAKITNSKATGNVSGDNQVGGFVGRVETAEFQNNEAHGSVSATSHSVGGFAGQLYDSEVINSHAHGDVSGTYSVGGFSGSNCTITVTESYATGQVSGTIENIGGFVGLIGGECSRSTISRSYATGAVSAAGADYVGGFAGFAENVDIQNAYARGGDDVVGNDVVGGFVGTANNTTLTNVYTTARLTGSTQGSLIADGEDNTISNSFWNTDLINSETSGGGTGITTAQMRLTSTFTDAGWNFSTVWGQNSTNNDQYPFLRFQGFTHVAPVVASTPTTRSSGGGSSSVRARVENLIAQGKTTEAEDLKEKWPQFFDASPTGSASEQLIKLQETLKKLLDLYREQTGREFTFTTPQTTTSPNNIVGMDVRDLTVGMEGNDVRALQTILINKNTGPAALALANITATGYFANYTRDALAEYQVTNDISPAQGYFGSITRSQMKSAGLSGLWW